jgi:hypothetical protein
MKRRYVLGGLAVIAALAIASTALGGPSLKSLVKKEVTKQLAGKTGPPGSQGPQGQQGPEGAQGAQGGPGVSGVHTVSLASASDSTPSRQHTAPCPAGEVAVGGGAFLVDDTVAGDPPNVALVRNLPAFVAGGAPTGWIGKALEVATGTADNWHITVQAVCAVVAP